MIILKQDMGIGVGFVYARGETLAEAEERLRNAMEAVRRQVVMGRRWTKEDRDYVLGVGLSYPPYEVVPEADHERVMP